MQEALTLLAYPKPHESPVAHLFGPSPREHCASITNSALVSMQGCHQDSRLETLCRQAAAVHKELRLGDCVAVQLVTAEEVLSGGLASEDHAARNGHAILEE